MRSQRTASKWMWGLALVGLVAAGCNLSDPVQGGQSDTGARDAGETGGIAQPDLGRNGRPRITGLEASPNPVPPGGTTTLEAEAEDPNGDDLEFRWKAGDEWSLSSQNDASVELQAPDRVRAGTDLQLEVRDGRGASARGTLYVETSADRPPSVETMTASPPQVEAGGTSTVEVSASDPDGDELSYEWTVPSGWSVDGSGASVDVTAPDKDGATATVEVEVSDGNGNATTARVVVTTTANDGPRVRSFTADPPQVERGGTIQVEVDAFDSDGDPLSYRWSVGGTNWSLNTTGPKADVTAPDAPGETARVEVVVKDTTDGTSVRAAVVVSTARNRPPALSTVVANPSTLEPGGTATLEASASDPEGDALTYSWSPPGSWSVSGSGATVDLQAPGTRGATATIPVTVEDSHGARVSGSVTVDTAANRAPSISTVTASPAIVEPQGSSTLKVYASDPDGDTLSYSWSGPQSWSRSGSGDSIQVTAPDQSNTTATFQVTVTDGNGGSTTGSVTVQTETTRNQAPEINSLSATPNPVLENEQSTVQVSASDPEGDALTYSWSLSNGNWTKSGSGDTITLSPPAAGSSSVTVTVTVEDSANNTTSSSVTVDSNGWGHSVEVTLDGNGLSSDKSGHPVRIDIPSSSNIHNYAASDGSDLRFASTQQNAAPTSFDVPYWIENWDPSGQSRVWIRVPSVPAGTTSSVYMYFDNSKASSNSKFSSVFKDVYRSSQDTTMSGTETYDWFELKSSHTISIPQGSTLTIEAQNIVIDGTIDGAGQGYAGGSTSSSGNGPGGGGTSSDAGAGGGGYGGYGGDGGYDSGDSPGSGGSPYGSKSTQSIEMGSGGGGSTDDPGGNGGSAVTLHGHDVDVSGSLLLNGVAPPSEGSSRNGGGGAGGGFLALSTHYRLGGSVDLSGGDGGAGSSSANDGGGGGAGGRYKTLFSDTRTNNGSIDTSGGTGGPYGDTSYGGDGDSGTTYRSNTLVTVVVSLGSVQSR